MEGNCEQDISLKNPWNKPKATETKLSLKCNPVGHSEALEARAITTVYIMEVYFFYQSSHQI